MTKVKLTKFKLKSEGKKIWLDWSSELIRRKDEVIATLKNEGVVSESCFISEDGECVYYFMEAEDFEKVKDPAASRRGIECTRSATRALPFFSAEYR